MTRISLLFVIAVSLPVLASSQTRGNATEEAVIREMMEATTKAFSNHDAKAWAQFCTPTARLVTVRGESMEGVNEIEKGLAAVFTTRAAVGHSTDTRHQHSVPQTGRRARVCHERDVRSDWCRWDDATSSSRT
jgi:ketosteroid isomerase-like protein